MFAVVFFAGCNGTLTATIYQAPDGRVIQTIHVNLPPSNENAVIIAEVIAQITAPGFGLDTPAGQKQITGSDGQQITFNYQMTATIEVAEDAPILRVTLDFANYYSFIWFNEIDLTTAREPEVEWSDNLFIRTRTITMQNPFARFQEAEEDSRGMRLKRHLVEGVGGDISDLQLVYVHLSSFRRTNAGEDYRRRNGDIWEYHFHANFGDDIPDIVIIDRVANPPIWYGIGAVASILFMLALWGVLKWRSGSGTQDKGQPGDLDPGHN